MIVVEFVQDPFFSVTFYVMFYWVIFLVPPIAYAFAIRRNHARRWRVIFCALVVVGMAECLSYIDGVPSSLLGLGTGGATEFLTSGRILVSAAVLIVSIVDLVAGERRDWLHWTGITTYVAGASVTLMWTIGYWSNR